MGKKSKSRGKAAGGKAKPSRNATNTSTPTIRSVAVDRLGRMPEHDGKRLYALLSALAMIVLPRLEAERKRSFKNNYRPIGWNPEGMAYNSNGNRVLVCGYILRNIKTLSQEVNEGVHQKILRSYLGRRITKEEKEIIASWQVHIEDDFFVIDHIPNRGTLFVQVGMSERQIEEYSHDNVALLDRLQHDIHPPRCFLVQGLATAFPEMLDPAVAQFNRQHPRAHRRYPGTEIATVRVALIPYLNGITYMGVLLTDTSFERFKHPKDFDEAVDTAVATANAVISKENDVGTLPLYERLDHKNDVGLRRLASDAHNEGGHRLMMSNGFIDPTERTLPEGTMELVYTQMYFSPTKTIADPNYRLLLGKAMGAERPFILEGFKNNTGQMLQVADTSPCPFHVHYGEETKTFAACCKETYLRRKEKANRKGNSMHAQVVCEPFGRKDLEAFGVNEQTRSLPPGLEKYMRMNFFENVGIEIKVSLECVPIIKGRLDECPWFHAVLPFKWIFFGALPTSHPQMGAMTFGDLELNPETGAFVADCLSAGRLKHMIIEMKGFCCDLVALSAKIVARPAHKVKANMEALEKNFELLQEGWEDVETEMIVDKAPNAAMGQCCAYCGEDDNDNLPFKCSCKSVYYCSERCRSKHWISHRDKCETLRCID